ncbi:MAG: hypothetical protein ACXWI5_02730 [Croceibacterium sp.]
MADDSIKTYPREPGGNVTLETLPTEARDSAMGRYMDAFSRLEGIVHIAISEIQQIDLVILRPVFAVMMAKQSIDLLEAVAHMHLTPEGATRVHNLCERLLRRNMRRNHIVHGKWIMVATISDDCVIQEWVRWYDHVNPELAQLRYTDPKLAGMYAFTVPGLDKATGHVVEMLQVVSALLEDLPSLRLQQQAPEAPAEA